MCDFTDLPATFLVRDRLLDSVPVGFTTICIPTALHGQLRQRKVHPRQAFHEVVARLLAKDPKPRKEGKPP